MSFLKASIERAVERRLAQPQCAQHIISAPPQTAPQAVSPTPLRKPKSLAQDLEDLRTVPSSHAHQLHRLQAHFETCISQPSRYVDHHQLSRWVRGAFMCVHHVCDTCCITLCDAL